MAASVFDSIALSALFPTGEAGRLFSDATEIRAMLLVEGALARVQGARGIIPAESAAAIARAAMEVLIDPAQLAAATGRNGVSVPGLIAAFRAAMQAPEHAGYIHWGATSQDIIDTGLMLRLRQALALIEADVDRALAALAELARDHADLAMPARTWGQHATPTSFGAVAAGWGAPLLALADELPDLRRQALVVSLFGAAGTASELGPDPDGLRAELAAALGLGDPGRNWHTDRTPLLRLADWLTCLTLALARMGEDLTGLAQTGIDEVTLGDAGSSSTMPQKRNPVAAAMLVAVARQGVALKAALDGAAIQRHQRDGAAWITEWMCLPQIVLGAASAAHVAAELALSIAPAPAAMAAALAGGRGLIHAEALGFALAAHLPRPEAQAAVKALCREASETGAHLRELVGRDWPALDTARLFDPAAQLGTAPAAARAFAAAVAARVSRRHPAPALSRPPGPA